MILATRNVGEVAGGVRICGRKLNSRIVKRGEWARRKNLQSLGQDESATLAGVGGPRFEFNPGLEFLSSPNCNPKRSRDGTKTASAMNAPSLNRLLSGQFRRAN